MSEFQDGDFRDSDDEDIFIPNADADLVDFLQDEEKESEEEDDSTEADEPMAPWFRIKNVTKSTGFPVAVQKVLSEQLIEGTSSLRVQSILTTLVNVIAVECGFVPLVDVGDGGEESECLRDADDVMRMSIIPRMELLISHLLKIIEKEKSLKRAQFKIIVENADDEESSKGGYKYAEDSITLVTKTEAAGLQLSVYSETFKKDAKFQIVEFLSDLTPKYLGDIKFTTKEFLTKAGFKAEKFSYALKHLFFYPLIDSKCGICYDFRGFQDAPKEMLVAIAKKLDMKSVVSLSMTNRNNYEILSDNTEVWRHLLNRMDKDIEAYGFQSFSYYSPKPSLSEESVSETYKKEFQRIVMQNSANRCNLSAGHYSRHRRWF